MMNNLPTVLGFSGSMQSFALSRFVLLYTIFGDICGNFVMGVVIDQASFDTATLIVFLGTCVAAAFWLVPAVWACQRDSPVTAHERQQARHTWRLARSATLTRIQASRAVGFMVHPAMPRRFLQYVASPALWCPSCEVPVQGSPHVVSPAQGVGGEGQAADAQGEAAEVAAV